VLDKGADPRMQAALLKALGLGAVAPAEAAAILADARKNLAGAADPSVFVSADALVFPPNAAPGKLAQDGLTAEGVKIFAADVSKPDGAKMVDDWVNDNTKGVIPEILGKPLDRPSFIALNALHFKAKWKEPFDPKQTAEAPFVGSDGKSQPTMLMHLPEAARAFRTEKGFVGVDLPFDGERYSLVVVTSTDKPKALKDFAPVKGWLSGAGFAAHKGDLALPKFSLETSTDLLPLVKDDLKDGLKSPTALAEFGSSATIQGILQRTKIDVFEEGAEAAAATAVVVGRALEVDDAVHMVVDKPYIFALRDRQSGFILAAGYVAKAPKGKGA
jgi:serpin B